MLAQEACHVLGILHLRGHAHLERLEAAHQQPAGPRSRRGPDEGPERADLLHHLSPADARTGDHITVASDELGRRVDHQVGAVLEGVLEHGAQERVVYHDHRPLTALCQRARKLHRALDVHQAVGGVGRRLDQHRGDPAARDPLAHALRDLGRRHTRREAHDFDPELGEVVVNQVLGAPV